MNKQDVNEYISGIIERITYHNPDNGFCVLRIKIKGHRDLITVTGNVPSILVGEYIKCSGIWYNDRNHGKQFKAHFIKALPPNTLEGIEKYLGSGLIKGIGPYFAKKLVLAFKDRVFEVIEHEPYLLSTVEGIGKVRANRICNNWQAQKVIREIMVFLQSHGVGTTRATRIYKTYGDKAIEIVSNNPYQLAKDIRGIGFISADTIARNLGIDKNSLIRAKAGVTHALLEATSNGHCGLPKKILLQNIQKLLEIEQEIVEQAIIEEVASNSLIIDTINDVESIFLTSYYIYEKNIAKILVNLTKTAVTWGEVDTDSVLPIEQDLGITLATSQKTAIEKALQHKVMVITGGPGTGKTTLVNSLLKTLTTKKLNIKLCAPTGRAAKRLSESTGLEATTIHRLLEIDPAYGGFKRSEESPLLCDYLVIDEASMVDISLFHALLKAIPPHSALLIVGDVDQLPSVGAGQVLKDIINSKVIPTVKLTEIFRQAATSKIIINAHQVNNGILPDLTSPKKESDFYFIEAEHGEDIINKIIIMIKDRIPNKFNLNPINDIQLLCPMQRGGVGARSLNIELQKILNPNYSSGITKFGQIFAIGDKVMQTENNYDKEVYNGDVGVINNINDHDQEITINFYNRDVVYDYSDLDQITLAYATTIHKSQGSEYPAVIIPLTMQSYMMLKRNLIYTAITRGKNLVIIIGQRKALAIAIKDNKTSLRYSKLQEWLITY
ncbi:MULTISPECIES: SF1B family DNA helicase RecD2 [spotted fever group]|uniref:ATP-dependent RecD2 DNA helicase n=1 Tax=Rickettsia tamurae subsp. buchneri TaxID=1462938 RepID=A0A8E0WK88_9RICK|nr:MULTISPECIES: ATP-dependent RecD-like DNA helicase [spotted fever group]EER20781.1 helicase, RecD/TraA family [Rickettsia endosymbiont of Ixodes scapularis]KDO02163.1 Exodeoxyribonuclease V alpha chain [Rickettsia tamurae subsp. buchneri]